MEGKAFLPDGRQQLAATSQPLSCGWNRMSDANEASEPIRTSRSQIGPNHYDRQLTRRQELENPRDYIKMSDSTHTNVQFQDRD